MGRAVTVGGMGLRAGVVTDGAARVADKRGEVRGVRAVETGMAGRVGALLVATGWRIQRQHDQPARDWPLWGLTAASALIVWRTKLHLLWLIGGGALLGMLGLV